MNILILSWRDPANPSSGGAERVTWKYARYWISLGHSITWISNRFPSSVADEKINGIKIVRVGPVLGQTVLSLLFTYPFFWLSVIVNAIKHKSDVVVDQIHGVPFFTPLFKNCRKILLVCEVADEIWSKMFPFPISFVGKAIERAVYMLYGSSEVWAISKSTKKDILKINPSLNVSILPLGIDLPKINKISKTSFPSAVFLARIVKMKGAESVIIAASKIKAHYPSFKLYMVGNGPAPYLEYLKSLVHSLDLDSAIEFCGKVKEDKKYKILQKSHFLIHPSHKEGFGLTVLEAGICKTPSIARSGSSLDELIKDKVDGLLFKDDSMISKLFIKYYRSQEYRGIASKIRLKTQDYSWDKVLVSSNKITKL